MLTLLLYERKLIKQRFGTRPILLISSGVMVVSSFLLAFGLNTGSQWASATGMLSFVAFFSFGLGPISWIVLSDVMPPRSTTAGGSIGIGLNWVINFVAVG